MLMIQHLPKGPVQGNDWHRWWHFNSLLLLTVQNFMFSGDRGNNEHAVLDVVQAHTDPNSGRGRGCSTCKEWTHSECYMWISSGQKFLFISLLVLDLLDVYLNIEKNSLLFKDLKMWDCIKESPSTPRVWASKIVYYIHRRTLTISPSSPINIKNCTIWSVRLYKYHQLGVSLWLSNPKQSFSFIAPF